jgi:hypothetical protein
MIRLSKVGEKEERRGGREGGQEEQDEREKIRCKMKKARQEEAGSVRVRRCGRSRKGRERM